MTNDTEVTEWNCIEEELKPEGKYYFGKNLQEKREAVIRGDMW